MYSFAIVILILSAALIAYHHFAYPVLLRWFAAWRRSHVRRGPANGDGPVPTKSVTLIVPAHNEAAVIEKKIANLAALDYPRDLLEVVIALDGCTDDTEALALKAIAALPQGFPIRLASYARNIGKVAVLNEQIRAAKGDVVALSDASANVAPDSLRRAMEHFADPNVGVVCGTYHLAAPGSEGERAYWDYQTRIKLDEATLAAPMGAHGAFYMFTRKAWSRLPSDTINDDFVLPMSIVARGLRAVYDPRIVALELEQTHAAQEFRRRVRIGAGNMQQTLRLASLGDPRRGWLAFLFWSGKGLRPFVPFLIIAALVASAILAASGNPVYRTLFAAELMTMALAALSLTRYEAFMPRPVAWLGYFFEGHTASFVGAMRFLTGSRIGSWQPAEAERLPFDGAPIIPASVAIGKRVFDIVFSVVILAVFALLVVPLALAIKLESPGPVFYRQRRVGRTTPEATYFFDLIKFRSMRQDAEAKSGPVLSAEKHDPRITRIGGFLRATRLDELPQCLNVLIGDMSVVGPRPERPAFFNRLEDDLPFYTERTFGLKPGLTGLAQVMQDYRSSITDINSKVAYDHAYALRLTSFWSWLKADVGILLMTVKVVLFPTGR